MWRSRFCLDSHKFMRAAAVASEYLVPWFHRWGCKRAELPSSALGDEEKNKTPNVRRKCDKSSPWSPEGKQTSFSWVTQSFIPRFFYFKSAFDLFVFLCGPISSSYLSQLIGMCLSFIFCFTHVTWISISYVCWCCIFISSVLVQWMISLLLFPF